MGHCYLTELGTLVTMAVKILAVVVTLASLAAAEPGYGYGGAYHPYGGHSYTYRTTQGLTGHHGYYGYGKRSADAGYGYGHGYGAASVYVSQADHGYGYHPAHYNYGYSIHKRSADAEPGYGHAVSYTHRSPQGLHGHYGGYGYGHGYYGYGMRSAEPGYYGHASSFVH